MDELRFTLNGQPIAEAEAPPNTTLLNYLRQRRGLTGTKEGCAEGDCGACTVAVLDPEAAGGPAWRAVNSCLLLLPMLQGKQVVTVEALGSGGEPHPAQASMAKHLGSQCGYCTPGIVMSIFEACYRRDLDAPWKLDDQLCGNLCRCTGYRPIREAAEAVAGSCPVDRFQGEAAEATPVDMALAYARGGQRHMNPTTQEGLWALLEAHPEARLVAGGTDLSLEITKQFKTLPLLISVEGVEGLRGVTAVEGGWRLGATTPLADIEAALGEAIPTLGRMLRFFGARQIKNRGTLGGNLCTASPIGDMPPALISLRAEAILGSRQGERRVPLEDFFVAYRKTALAPGEILAGVFVPDLAGLNLRAAAYKVSKRQELDISTVSAGLAVELDDAGRVVDARLAFGGMAATPKRAAAAEAALVGQPWTREAVEAAAQRLDADFAPLSDHRGSAWYRATVARNLLLGFYLETERTPRPHLPYRPTATVQIPTP